jgi:hypothetical protein
MSDEPIYTFLPWSRLGVANSIMQTDGDASVMVRATIPIDFDLELDKVGGGKQISTVHKDIQIFGPGDIVGIDAKAVVKTEPANWITNFEPNLVPYIEFYDEDFPWRYTPAHTGGPNDARLRPWLTLVVLAEDEFTEITNIQGRPLPAFELDPDKPAADVFPFAAELWAWSHVHVNRKLDVISPAAALASTLAKDPDLASARIICPRRLAASTTYHAFVIPTFESGRLAGLGAEVPASLVATRSAWDAGQVEFPYYYRWRFRTGALGDFEYLVRLLVPQPCDKRVGVRDIDVLHPGSDLSPITTPENIGGKLKLGGALKVPNDTLSPNDLEEVLTYDTWDEHSPAYPHPFQEALAKRINLADDYTQEGVIADADGNQDPVITSPLYGQWHALTERLLENSAGAPLPNRTNWIHELNLDPRFRVAAGLGTRVVRTNQEELVDAAWQQAGDVIAANSAMRHAQVARETGLRLLSRHVDKLDAGRVMMLTASLHRRVLSDGVTVRHKVQQSKLPLASMAPAFRRMVRARGRVARRMGTAMTAPGATAQLVVRLGTGQLVSAPEWEIESGLLESSLIKSAVAKPHVLNTLKESFARSARTPAAVDQLPKRPDFVATPRGHKPIGTRGATDGHEALRFKTALKDAYELATPPPKPAAAKSADVDSIATQVKQSIDPTKCVVKHYYASYAIPSWIAKVQAESFVPCLVYPEFDRPMYKPLADLSSELFLPNINLIPQNSITLLETNQKFIESYMVGLNHEMSRELLWREYPTDQRGSYFRQFWDVTSVYPGNPPPDDIREQLRDIPPIHKWSKQSELGMHNQREPDDDDAQLVLVVRGELLKRYPNAVIYAMKARWTKNEDGELDATLERHVVNLSDAEEADPPKSKVRTPLFEARITPDIFFIGFDLSALEARGAAKGVAPVDGSGDNAGWFFVLQERPGEPRFGLDQPPAARQSAPKLVNWNSLHWGTVGTAVGACVRLDKTISLHPELWSASADDADNKPLQDPDQDPQATWGAQTTAAQLAYIFYQVPVMVAVHAWRMLPS